MQLTLQEIHGQTSGPHVLITGGVHGDEFEPMAAVRRLLNVLRQTDLRGRVTLVPVVNEPAFRLGQRAAEDGLDLAPPCPGGAGGSVPEQTAPVLSERFRAADYYTALPPGGPRLCVLPLVGYTLHPDPAVLA